MPAAEFDFIGDEAIEQGATLARAIVWDDDNGVPKVLTGYTARMQVRGSVGSAVKLLELTTENNGIAITPGTGTITLTQTATQTAAFAWKKGVYDLELVAPDGTVTRLLKGAVEVSPEVTR